MRAKAQRWGKTLAVRIPKAIAERAGVCEGDTLEIEMEGSLIRIKRCRQKPILGQLLHTLAAERPGAAESSGGGSDGAQRGALSE